MLNPGSLQLSGLRLCRRCALSFFFFFFKIHNGLCRELFRITEAWKIDGSSVPVHFSVGNRAFFPLCTLSLPALLGLVQVKQHFGCHEEAAPVCWMQGTVENSHVTVTVHFSVPRTACNCQLWGIWHSRSVSGGFLCLLGWYELCQ